MNPYLLPNFHSVSDKNQPLNTLHNRCAFTSLTDFNGCGLIGGDICVKYKKAANFYARSPTLPYFINRSLHQNKFAAKNCLIYCKNEDKKLLLATDDKSIIGLLIDDKVIDSETNAQNKDNESKPHIYSRDESLSNGPFRYCTQQLFDLYLDDEEEEEDQELRPVLELSVHFDVDSGPQIQSNSRKKINFFRFKSDDNSDISLEPFHKISIETVARSDGSLFESCQRNEFLGHEVLISYKTDNVIDLYDLETNNIIRSFDSCIDPKQTQIGLQWDESHPRFFTYGDHKRLKYCDSRSLKTVLEIFNRKSYNSFEWELFYQFLPSKVNPNELFLATDYHIIVIDWRFPKKNLNQLNHMIPNTIIRSLRSLKVDNTNTELLLSSNFYRNCLMSFSCSPPLVSLTSRHLPIHLSTPEDVSKQFENYVIRGLELIDSTDGSGFSLAVLTNSGDIHIQDLFWITTDEELNAREGDPLYRDRTYCSGIGSSSLHLEEKSIQYMDAIEMFLYKLKSKVEVDYNDVNVCLTCNLHRVCKIVTDECQCINLPVFAAHFMASRPQPDRKTDTEAVIKKRCKTHLRPQILNNKQKLEDKQQLAKTTDKYSKNLFKLWEVFDND